MEVNYVIQKSRRRSMSIHVADDKKVIVKVPLGTPTFIAEKFMMEKKDWIMKQMEKVENQTALADSMGPLTEEDIKQIKKKAKKVIPEISLLAFLAVHTGDGCILIFCGLMKITESRDSVLSF